MIVLDLVCDSQHRFEGWFANADAFADQRACGLVECPRCGSTHVERLPSAPYLNTSAPRGDDAPPRPPVDPDQVMAALRAAARKAEDVGDRFPVEVRRIHYGEAEARNIRGRASGDDLTELLEEGIPVLPIPDEPPLQ